MTADKDLVGRLRELFAKATPGEWRTMRAGNAPIADGTLVGQSYVEPVPRPYEPRWVGWKSESTARAWNHTTVLRDEDADLIVALRNEVPALLDRIEQLEAQLAACDAAHRKQDTELNVALEQAAARAEPQPVAWLIERGQNQGQTPTVWLQQAGRQDGTAVWTENASKAHRYPTRAKAEGAIQTLGIQHAVATEHIFLAPPACALGGDESDHILKSYLAHDSGYALGFQEAREAAAGIAAREAWELATDAPNERQQVAERIEKDCRALEPKA